MVEAVMLWNEPNNLSHWDFSIDKDWRIFADMINKAGVAVANESKSVTRVLGGISPIDPAFMQRMKDFRCSKTSTQSRCMASRWIGIIG